MFYKALVQSIILFGSETWVVINPMITDLELFHHRATRWISGKIPYYLHKTDKWIYPPIDKVL